MQAEEIDFRQKIRTFVDFPHAGIAFRDISPWLNDGPAFVAAIDTLRARVGHLRPIDGVVGPEARGFVLGAPLAYAMSAGFVPVRKAGKLPGSVEKVVYQLEYGEDSLAIQTDALTPGQQVILADDLLATGGTIAAVCELLAALHVKAVAAVFMVELIHLQGRTRLPKDLEVISLVQYQE